MKKQTNPFYSQWVALILQEVCQILLYIETNDATDIDSEIEADRALKSGSSIHDIALTRNKSEEVEIDQRRDLRQKIACKSNFFL